MKKWMLGALLALVPIATPAFAQVPAARTAADTLRLEDLESEVLRRNPSLAARRDAADAARARARVAGALEVPMIEAMVAPGSLTSDSPGWRVSATQRFSPFGSRGLARAARSAEADAVANEAEAARLDVLQTTRESYFALYRLTRAAETNAEQTRLMEQFRRVALTRYSAATSGQQDVLDADAELAMLAHEGASVERERRAVLAQINTLLHRAPAESLPAMPRTLEVPQDLVFLVAAGAALPVPPEKSAADARVASRRADLAFARRERLPLVTVGGAFDRFMEESEWRPQAIVGLELPIWPGRVNAMTDEARAELARAESEREAVADEVARRIEVARAEYEESLHEVEVLEERLLPTSERALSAARAGFESSRGSFMAAVLAARRLGTAKLELEEARVRAANGWAALRRARAVDLQPSEERRP